MILRFSDAEPTFLSRAISATDTVFTVANSGGSTYPTDAFCVTLCDTSVGTGGLGFLSAKETVFVGKRVGDTFSNIVRGWAVEDGGGAARAWDVGATLAALVPSKVLNGFVQRDDTRLLASEEVAALRQLLMSNAGQTLGIPVGFTIGCAYETSGLDDTVARLLYCNGRAVSRTDYAKLFEVIGVLHGVGDGNSTFNLPDMRGLVAKGLNDGRYQFADSGSLRVGSFQDDAIPRITGSFLVDDRSDGDSALFSREQLNGGKIGAEGTSDAFYAKITFDSQKTVKTAEETRVKTIMQKFYIRY